MRHRFEGSPFEQRFFVLAPHLGPYSLFRSLGDILVVPLGPLGAIRAIATLPGDRDAVRAAVGAKAAARQSIDDGRLLRSRARLRVHDAPRFRELSARRRGPHRRAARCWLELMVATDDRAPAASKWELASACLAPCVLLAHGHAFVIFLGLAAVSAVATGDADAAPLAASRPCCPRWALAAWAASARARRRASRPVRSRCRHAADRAPTSRASSTS